MLSSQWCIITTSSTSTTMSWWTNYTPRIIIYNFLHEYNPINIAVYKPEGNDSAVASKGKSNSSSSPDKDFLSFPNYPCIDYESRSRVGLNPRLERSIFHLAGPLLKLESLELHLVYFIGNYPSFHQAICYNRSSDLASRYSGSRHQLSAPHPNNNVILCCGDSSEL